MIQIKEYNIAIDLDGVCCNFQRIFSQVANTLFGDRCPILIGDEATYWDWEKFYPINKKEISMCWDYIEKVKNFWLTLEPWDLSGLMYMRDALSDIEFVNMYFITARHKTLGYSIAKQSRIWLEEHGIKNAQVLGAFDKTPILNGLQIRDYIDDNTDNVSNALAYSTNGLDVYAYDCKHNRSLDMEFAFHAKYHRVNNLKEFTEKVMLKL